MTREHVELEHLVGIREGTPTTQPCYVFKVKRENVRIRIGMQKVHIRPGMQLQYTPGGDTHTHTHTLCIRMGSCVFRLEHIEFHPKTHATIKA